MYQIILSEFAVIFNSVQFLLFFGRKLFSISVGFKPGADFINRFQHITSNIVL